MVKASRVSGARIILDADILSMFAKVDAVDLPPTSGRWGMENLH
jgi:hypothetical protein